MMGTSVKFVLAFAVLAALFVAACAVVPAGDGGVGIGIDPFYHGYHHGW